jgi:hypothetical protein
MNAASPNAISFPWATLMPTEPAARSLERIASSIRPAGPRRRRATSNPSRITTTSTITPKTTRLVERPELIANSLAAFTSISLLAIVFVAGVGRIAGAVVAGIMFSAAGLFVTFLDIHLSVGKYQAIVAGLALELTAVQNPDGLTSTSTGKGPAVALMKLRERVLGLRKPGTAATSPGDGAGTPSTDPAPEKLDVHHPVA